jgi:hypothetical protein
MNTEIRLTLIAALALFALMIGSDTIAQTPQKFELRYRLDEGTRFAVHKERVHWLINPEDRDTRTSLGEDKSVWLGQTLQSDENGLDLEFEYAEWTRDSWSSEGIVAFDFSELFGHKVKARLSPLGSISSFRGFLVLPETTVPDVRGMRTNLGRMDYTNEFRIVFPELPVEPVGVGDTWSYEDSYFEMVASGYLRVAVLVKYTVVEPTVREGLACLRCRGEFTVTITGRGAEGDIDLALDMQGKGEETMYFAYEKGMVLEYEGRTEVSGTASNEERGFSVPLIREIESRMVVEF